MIVMPFIENLQIIDSGGTTPTLCWDAVDEADAYRVRAMDLNLNKYWDSYLPANDTCYQFPENVLFPGQTVYLRVEAWQNDNGRIENRSVFIEQYTPDNG